MKLVYILYFKAHHLHLKCVIIVNFISVSNNAFNFIKSFKNVILNRLQEPGNLTQF